MVWNLTLAYLVGWHQPSVTQRNQHMDTWRHGNTWTHGHMDTPTCIWHIWQSLPSLRLQNIVKCWIKVKFTNHKWKTRQLFGFHLLFINFAIINSDLVQTMFDSQFSLDWQWHIIPCFGIVSPHVQAMLEANHQVWFVLNIQIHMSRKDLRHCGVDKHISTHPALTVS